MPYKNPTSYQDIYEDWLHPSDPEIVSAQSLNGHEVEISFSRPVLLTGAAIDPTQWVLDPIYGAPAHVLEVTPSLDSMSVRLRVSGTTLGGQYTLTVSDVLQDIQGYTLRSEPFVFYTLGDVPSYMVEDITGNTVTLRFSEPLLRGPGVIDPCSYHLSTDYPIPMTVGSVIQSQDDQVQLQCVGMTSVDYHLTITDAIAISEGNIPAGSLIPDTTGKLRPASSFRMDVSFGGDRCQVDICDGECLVTLLREDSFVKVMSGTFAAQISVVDPLHELTLIRNQKGQFYTVLAQDVVVITIPVSEMTGQDTFAGVRCQSPLQHLHLTSSQTVYSEAWNFMHGVGYTFVGSSATANPVIMTKHGPLVKTWGDTTPATKADVVVRLNGVSVEIDTINPYLGSITPTIPIPLTPKGTNTIEVDYTWFPAPIMQMAALNTPGLTLNTWGQSGNHASSTTGDSTQVGVAPQHRFVMSVVLPSPKYADPKPKWIGHRYMGYQKLYTASLNSPTSLLLNQNPHTASSGVLRKSQKDLAYSYEGRVLPTIDWRATGSDRGYLGSGTNAGYYILDDVGIEQYPFGNAAFYYRQEDLSFPSTGQMSIRMNASAYTLDGVFAGLGFGMHENRHLYLMGFLEINGIRHIGLLLNPEEPSLRESWQIGPAMDITLVSQDTFTTTDQAFIAMIQRGGGSGVVFQILDGTQAGVYTLTQCGVSVNGSGTIATGTITGSFPSPYNVEGGMYANAYVETDWVGRTLTYRMVANVQQGSVELYLGGSITGVILTQDAAPAYPAQTTLILPTTKRGTLFWGSLSRVATSTSRWAFVRYGITYDQSTFSFQGIVVDADMNQPPNQDVNHPWFVSENFGSASSIAPNTLLVDSNIATTDLDSTFGYARVEPFLTEQTMVDVDTQYKVISGSSGIADSQVVISNGVKQVTFGTLAYVDIVGGRRLVQLPAPVTISALQDPTLEGWTSTGTGTASIQENRLLGNPNLQWAQSIIPTADITGSSIFEATFKVVSSSGFSLTSGPRFGGRFTSTGRDVEIALTDSPKRVKVLSAGSAIASYALNWDDGQYHTYRVSCDAGTSTASIYVDNTLLGTLAYSAFTSLGSPYLTRFGFLGVAASGQVLWESVSHSTAPASAVKKTLGVLVGSDPTDIDAWSIPRTDTSNAPNSSSYAVVEDVDWSSVFHARVRLDPQWGVTVFLPDLSPPPYYTGDFATLYTEPSAGWINVEYRDLPSALETFGRISFGALKASAVTLHEWQSVQYRIYTTGTQDNLAPQFMVLNRANVISSGEYNTDRTLESVWVEAIDATHVSLKPCHIYASRVYTVVVDDIVLPSTSWTFNVDTQVITLNTPLSNPHSYVNVNFVASKPVTNTYLCSQPLLQSVTLLNAGTPIVPLSQTGSFTRTVSYGGIVTDPSGTTDTIDNTPYQQLSFSNDNLYENLEICTVEDGGEDAYISSISDTMGWVAMALEGTRFSDQTSQEGGPGRGWGSMTIRDNVGNFEQVNQMVWLGGRKAVPQGSTWGTGIMYPTYHSGLATVRSLQLHMRIRAVLLDGSTPEIETLLEDTIPTSEDTSATVVVSDYATTSFSRFGPWGGSYALSLHSLWAGGSPDTSNAFTWEGGVPLDESPTITEIVL